MKHLAVALLSFALGVLAAPLGSGAQQAGTASDVKEQERQACEVAAGPFETGDKSALDRIGGDGHDNGDRSRCTFGRKR